MRFRTAMWISCALPVLAACDRVFGVPVPVVGDGASIDSGDAGSDFDAGPLDPAIVAHWRFDSSAVIADEAGRHDGTATGLETIAGVSGNAITFPDAIPHPHVLVPNASDWDLPEGAIELWVRPAASTTATLGILSRDNTGTSDGHFFLMQLGTRFFVVRIQRSTDGGGGDGMFLCSDQAPTPGTWMHVGINLGAPVAELWVDGILGTRTDTFTFGQVYTCNNAPEARSIIGNDDPWVFGALTVQSEPGTTSAITSPFVGGAIDELIIWRTRRDFRRP